MLSRCRVDDGDVELHHAEAQTHRGERQTRICGACLAIAFIEGGGVFQRPVGRYFSRHGFPLEIKAEGLRETEPSNGRHDNRAPGRSFEPAKAKQALLERSAKTPGKVRSALTPIQTGPAQEAFGWASPFNGEAEILEKVAASIGDLARLGGKHDHMFFNESVGKRDAEAAGQVVETGPGLAKGRIDAACLATKLFIPVRGDRHDGFQHAGHLSGGEAIIAMPALADDRGEMALSELRQMFACRGPSNGWPAAASSVAVRVRPLKSATSILARPGSPISAEISAIFEPEVMALR